MATKIITKNSSTTTAIPTAGDLVQGELAVNVTDKRLFTENSAGAIVELGTNPSTLTVTGEIAANGGIALGDNDKATFGAGDDLQIYHDGSNSWVKDSGDGVLALASNGNGVGLYNADGTKPMVFGTVDSDVKIYHNGLLKLATTATGIDVTGAATFSGNVNSTAAGENLFSNVGNVSLAVQSNATDKISIGVEQGVGGTFVASGGALKFRVGGYTAAFDKAQIDASGNLGLGTSSPVSFGANTSFFTANGTSSGNGYACQVAGTNYGLMYASTNLLTISAEGASTPMAFATNNATRMVLDTSGNLTLNTANSTLNVGNGGFSQTNYGLLGLNGASGGFIKMGTAGVEQGAVYANSGGLTFQTPAAYGMTWYPAGALAMTLDPSGNLHVGGTDAAYPDTKLITGSYSAGASGISILSSSSGVGYLLFGDGTGTAGYSGQINYNHNQNRMGFNTNNVEYMAINSVGDLLLNTAVPLVNGKQSLLFNGSTHNGLVLKTTRVALNSTFAAFINVSGSICGSIIQNGTTTVHYSASSDKRLKENISDSDDSGSVIDAIQVRKFDWIGTDEHERFGFIAQELQEVVPVAVCSMGMADEEDPMLGVDPSKLMALAIKEIQSLRARIAILEGA